MKKRGVAWLALLVWGVPVIVLALVFGLTPNVVLCEADAGVFVSAEAHPGGFFGPDVMTVQTTRGTLTLRGLFTALRGQPLVIKDSSKDGVQVCGQHASDACMDLIGRYIGTLTPVPHVPVWLTDPRRHWLDVGLVSWGILGLIGFAWMWIVGTDDEGASNTDNAYDADAGQGDPR